jgi:mannosyltransferase PIG-V
MTTGHPPLKGTAEDDGGGNAPVPVHSPPLFRRLTSFEGIEALIAIGLWKLGTFATAYIAWALLPFNQELYTANYRYGDRIPTSFAASLDTWDSQHYIRLAERGYEEGLLSNAFGPLYPLLIRVTNLVTGDSIVSGLLVANVASAAALYLLYLLVSRRWNREMAFATLLLCMAFPTAFFLNLIYTEALFLLLMVVVFYALYERSLWLAAAAAFLLPLLRVPGLVAIVPMLWVLGGDALRLSLEGPRLRFGGFRWSNELLYLLAPVAGFAAYLVWMHVEAGNAFVAMDTEKQFISHRALENVLRPDELLADFFRSSYSVHNYLDSVIDRIFFVAFVVSLPVVYRNVDKPMFLFYLVIGLQPLLGSFMSYTRLLMVAFPLFIAWAVQFARWEPRLTYAVAYPMLLVQSVFLALHVNSNWVA